MTLKYAQIIILAAVFMLQYLFEHIYPQRKERNNWKNERFNLLIGLANTALVLFPATLFVKAIEWMELNKAGLLHRFTIPFWFNVILTILILDLWMYLWHRLNHTAPFLWKFHLFHHKDVKMNSTTALRFHTVELLLSYPGKLLICFLFGISYLPLFFYEILFFISIVIHHSNIYITERADNIYKMLFVSPIMHRIHHSIKKEERNTNYGALFSFWDRLFNSNANKAKGVIEFGVAAD